MSRKIEILSKKPARASVATTSNFTCGIDIGTENLAISFIEITMGDAVPRIISYKGTLNDVLRFEMGEETTKLTPAKLSRGKLHQHEAYVAILSIIPEFSQTTNTVIEMQLSCSKSLMSRLDGIAFGFLKGSFPSMSVSLHASTIRTKFISDRVSEEETNRVKIPRGYRTTKLQSIAFVATKLPAYYNFIEENPEINKIDDICDSIVYAAIAIVKHIDNLERQKR